MQVFVTQYEQNEIKNIGLEVHLSTNQFEERYVLNHNYNTLKAILHYTCFRTPCIPCVTECCERYSVTLGQCFNNS